jgi:hypothetical protein
MLVGAACPAAAQDNVFYIYPTISGVGTVSFSSLFSGKQVT